MRIFDANPPGFDAANSPGSIPQKHDVAGKTLDREVLIDAADHDAFRFGYDGIVCGIRNGSAGGDRRKPRPAARSNPVIDAIVMQVSLSAAAARRDSFGEHSKHGIEVVAFKIAIGIGAPDHLEQITFLPFLRCRGSDDLLRKDVERRRRNLDSIEISRSDRRG